MFYFFVVELFFKYSDFAFTCRYYPTLIEKVRPKPSKKLPPKM